MHNKQIWVAFLCIFFTNCNQQFDSNEIIAEHIVKIDVNKSSTMDISDSADIVACIPLETTENSLIKTISKIVITDSIILIFDLDRSNIFLFEKEGGKFVRKIGSKGEGPGEYLMFNDIWFEESTGFLYAHERMRRVMQIYRLSGELIKEIPSRHWFRSFCKVENGYWVYSCYKSGNPKDYNLQLLDENLDRVIANYFPQKEFFPTVMQPNFFQDEKKNNYFIYANSNVVYCLKNETPEPYLLIDFGNRTLPYEQIASMTDDREYDKLVLEKEYLGYLTTYHFYEDWFYFSFYGSSRKSAPTYSARYHLKDSTINIYDGYTDYKAPQEPAFNGLTFMEPVGTYKDELIYAINPNEMNDEAIGLMQKKGFESINEESNPILFFVKSK